MDSTPATTPPSQDPSPSGNGPPLDPGAPSPGTAAKPLDAVAVPVGGSAAAPAENPATAPAGAPAVNPADAPVVAPASALDDPGFKGRGSMRRRARFLRKARELAYRDLGGLVFNLHRFGQRNDVLVIAKLTTLSHIDTELRALEAALEERHPVTILREAGVTACPRCAAIHSGDDRFCPNCGLSMSRRVDLPVAGAPAPASNAPGAYPQTPTPAASTAVPAPASGAAGASGPQTSVRPGSPGPAPANAGPVGTPGAPGNTPGDTAGPGGTPGPAAVPPPASDQSTTPVKAPSSAPGGDQPTEVIRPPARGT